jgi:ketosteroid isomerase-like protein
VRRGYEAYESDGIEGIISFLDPDVEWGTPPDSPIAGVFHGHDGVREWQRLANEAWMCPSRT